MAIEESGLTQYLSSLRFSPDPYQEEALERVALGHSVLVCAPTGAGKTVVGEGATDLARRRGERVFYTTPIKALSNQKLRDFRDRFGESEVGLLTGDTAINPNAPIIVMTTEVLRNMIYAGADLSDLGVVVMDEVHYLSDKFRGPVWEEILIQLPDHVRVVALSATLSNAGEFGRWVESVRGTCDVVTSEKRPVPLYQHMIVGGRLFDLYARPKQAAKHPGSSPLNPDLLAAVQQANFREGRPARRGNRRPAPVQRFRVLDSLRRTKLLPAIVFIFSRAGCEDAADEAARYGLNLTSSEEREAIRAEVAKTLDTIPAQDHTALGLHAWAWNLEEGVAAHHAGLLPQQKEAVENLFDAGLVKVVFATETLALGINMPARTVVLEALEKWDGSEHVRLSPREYTQLTGRAGRRGIDVEGHAVVLERSVVTPEEVADLSSGRSYPLHSAFVPNYNMAVNLLARLDRKQAQEILESSFAQFQADASVVKDARKLKRVTADLAQASRRLHCDRGDAAEYFALREEIGSLQKQISRARRADKRQQTQATLRHLRLGDVVKTRRGRRFISAVVVQPPSPDFSTPVARVVYEDAKLGSVGPREAEDGLSVLGRMVVPRAGARRPKDRAALAAALRHRDYSRKNTKKVGREDDAAQELQSQAARLESEMRAHPVHGCPDLDQHAVVGHQYARLLREEKALAKKINARSAKIVDDFASVCAVLDDLGFLDGNRVTGKGQRLRRIYGDRDLLVAQAVAAGAWDHLKPEELSSMVSALVYEPRGEDVSEAPNRFPTGGLEDAWADTQAAFDKIHKVELAHGHEVTSQPSGALMDAVYRWAKDASLAAILEQTELSGGDFVRWIRQVLDMLDQLRRIEGTPVAKAASAARQRLLHGVVAWTEFA